MHEDKKEKEVQAVFADVLNPNWSWTNVLEMAGHSDKDRTETDPVGAH